ncbi:MAG TPA: DUF371 domain-containing protein [Candidatus Nanoarchaeia archaeon]|nr:DUF371 domain-containing protein [Candidatus Nanoarchaeia archaeon]
MNPKYSFFAYGHNNILATHNKTLEFTKDKGLSLRGDCIVGVNSDFEQAELLQLIRKNKSCKIKILIDSVPESKNLHDEISAEINPDFANGHELVVRKTGFVSDRTFAVNSDKSSLELSRELVRFLKNAKNKIKITFEFLPK